MNENAIFHITEDIPDEGQRYLLNQLEKKCYINAHSESPEEIKVALDQLYDIFVNMIRKRCPLHVPVDFVDNMPDDIDYEEGAEFTVANDVRLAPKTVEQDGKKYFAVFTSKEELNQGQSSHSCTTKTDIILDKAAFNYSVSGIVVNPFGKSPLCVPKEIIRSMFISASDIDSTPKAEKYYKKNKGKNIEPTRDLDDAIQMAFNIYRDKKVMDTNTTFVVQAMGTASILGDVYGGPDLVISGILAPAVREGTLKIIEVEPLFGIRTAQILSSQTEDETLPWFYRKLLYINDIAKTDDAEIQILAMALALSELRSIYRVYKQDETIVDWLDAPCPAVAIYYREICKVMSKHSMEKIIEHTYSEMVELYKKLFMIYAE